MDAPVKPSGLCQRIRTATSNEEVERLQDEGKTYQFASERTKGRWERAVHRTLKRLFEAPSPTAAGDAK
jgi:hypothetical protein